MDKFELVGFANVSESTNAIFDRVYRAHVQSKRCQALSSTLLKPLSVEDWLKKSGYSRNQAALSLTRGTLKLSLHYPRNAKRATQKKKGKKTYSRKSAPPSGPTSSQATDPQPSMMLDMPFWLPHGELQRVTVTTMEYGLYHVGLQLHTYILSEYIFLTFCVRTLYRTLDVEHVHVQYVMHGCWCRLNEGSPGGCRRYKLPRT